MKVGAAASVLGAMAVGALSAVPACGGAQNESQPASTVTVTDPSPRVTPPADSPSPSARPESSAVSTPVAASAGPTDGDSRTMESITALVKASRKEARECYEKALKQIPGLKGDVVVRFTLKPSGKIKQIELNTERSTIREASVTSCVIAVVSAIEFPKSSKGMLTTVNYPFNFTP